ncbi:MULTISPECIES: LruC domain-containing protein [Colwellia]|uniref:LruC domain-containing protein n=1 Tax=Colwellia marinimaniae TaxID=1513592 RepID=A0ABQ0MYH8_9GAMM|nr:MULTISPECIES: LruC domain-containing protein [Colwellia]GAW97426.1 LruC domain-containing protein [Colwellia marinimaniae]
MIYLKKIRILSFAGLMIFHLSLNAAPFESCPSKAFLMQQQVAKLYGVNLVTGNYSLLSDDLGTTGKINAIGFNFHDNYLYGWGYEWGTLVRIGSDYQATPITLLYNPGVNFYVGDIALNENSYYFYKKGASYGLYKVSLDVQSDDYMQVIKVIDGQALSLTIFDFAFHPTNNLLYTVDRDGQLYQINVTSGVATALANVGEQGTFGAVYFDIDGYLYISRNSDGYVFIIDVADSNPQATFFAYGPSASQNDGARCALAPIVDESVAATTDYGDAPDSYGTTLFSNGARHSVSDNYLGTSITTEHNAKVYPKTDEDDGIIFLTPLLAGSDSLIQVQVTGAGYLNIWADWDRDGQFTADEKLISDKYMADTTEVILVNTPLTALNGFTWTRARFTTVAAVVASGGVSDGEVEDYRVLVTNPGNSQIQDTPYYLAFEDSWPEQGDYDMNDVVILQNSSLLLTDTYAVKQIEFQGEVKALGASYHNGFAIQLDNILASNVDTSLVRFEINGVLQESSAIEEGTQYLVINITDDLRNHIQLSQDCLYYRTESNCSNSSLMTFSVTVPFITAIALEQFPQAPYNPFIFAQEGTYHGDLFFHPGRGLEIHLKNKKPTSKADDSLFGLADDRTQVSGENTYQTSKGLPWALAINPGSQEEWQHPSEMVDILHAYPDFQKFIESNGNKATSWFAQSNAVNSKLY